MHTGLTDESKHCCKDYRLSEKTGGFFIEGNEMKRYLRDYSSQTLFQSWEAKQKEAMDEYPIHNINNMIQNMAA